jgi:ATP-dependent helicase HrpB
VRRLILSEKSGGTISPEIIALGVSAKIKKEGVGCLPWNDMLKNLRARESFVRRHKHSELPDLSDEALSESINDWLIPFLACDGKEVLTEEIFGKALSYKIGWKNIRTIDAEAPESLDLPSGNSRSVDYGSGEIPILAARLQEFFGCTETPKLCGIPLLLHLLSPAGRPVQITRDLDGFWDRAYPEVKKELAGRYPKHVWPENPREAEPTSRTKPRKQQ